MNVSDPTAGGTGGQSAGGLSGAEMDTGDLEGDVLGAPEDSVKKPSARTVTPPCAPGISV